MITSVETLKGATFIRNGSEYAATNAAQHLRLKLGKAGERVQTADQFIAGCATKSSFSGKKYQLRLASGETVDTEVYLRKRLAAADAKK